MKIFDFFKKADINAGYEKYKNSPNALLLDVRDVDEFKGGRIPGAVNLPLGEISRFTELEQDKDKEIYVYCLGGGRSQRATNYLNALGFNKAENIGGISDYKGPIEK